MHDENILKRNMALHYFILFCAFALSSGCGVSKVAKGRVIGGRNAKAEAWPWQIGIFEKNKFVCGGTLVNRRWIVTAAHCIEKVNKYNIKVKLGDLDRDKYEGEQILSLSDMIMHPSYEKPLMVDNDIALLKLSKAAMLNNRVQPACLPKKGEQQNIGSTCFITGWGKILHSGRTHPKLQQLGLQIQSNKVCRDKNKKFLVSNKMICAGNIKSKSSESGCHGDSGGPFVCQQKNGRWKLQGVVSWGSPKCDSNDAFSVFVKVEQYIDWINKYIYS